MACPLVGAKPLSEPMLEFCHLDHWEPTSVYFDLNSNIFIHENGFESVVCEMGAMLSRPQCLNGKPRMTFYTPAQRSWRGGILDSPCQSVRLSVCPSVCRRHGFRSISQVWFGISISNFICMLMVAIGRSLLIFSDVTFKMAAWWPYWIFWFPDSNFTLALNINFELQRHNTYVYG